MYKRIPWTRDQLDELIPEIQQELDDIEKDFEEEVNPIPPLTADEAAEYIMRLLGAAKERLLTDHECFLHGQLLSVFKMAIQAETLGHKKAGGRYFVVSEEEISKLLSRQ